MSKMSKNIKNIQKHLNCPKNNKIDNIGILDSGASKNAEFLYGEMDPWEGHAKGGRKDAKGRNLRPPRPE